MSAKDDTHPSTADELIQSEMAERAADEGRSDLAGQRSQRKWFRERGPSMDDGWLFIQRSAWHRATAVPLRRWRRGGMRCAGHV